MSFLKSCLNSLLKPAEDPRQGAVYTDERQRAMLVKVRGLLADISQTRQQLQAKTAQLTTTIAALERQVRQDLSHGRDDVARRRLQRQQIMKLEHQMLQAQLGNLDLEEQRLLLAEQRLVTHIEAYVARREAIKARYSSAESQMQLNKGLQKVFRDLADLEQIIDLAEWQTDQMEAHASVLDEDIENDLWLQTTAGANPLAELANSVDLNEMVAAELARLKEEVKEIS